MEHDSLTDWDRVHLERLKLAADVLLSEAGALPESLEEELSLYRDRVERALLLPASQSVRSRAPASSRRDDLGLLPFPQARPKCEDLPQF
jgi:hypothetical protein